jgi:AhpD family alkylhydroperoxidase
MPQSYLELDQEVQQQMNAYARESPDLMKSFMQLHKNSSQDGALPKKIKELIALSISICVHCDGCIAYHVYDAIEAGATHEEIVETIGVAILMGGGPSVVYGSRALQALQEFENNNDK